MLTREQEQFAQFAAEKFGARRVGEAQCGQRAQQFEVAGVAAIDRFDADDGGHHFARHAEFLLGAFEGSGVLGQEFAAGADAQRLDEAAAVARP